MLTTTGITTEDRKKYDRVLEKLNGFFKVRRNIVFERARFNQRSQGENESVEKYITELYHLAETCEYGDLKEQLLRDRIVVGIRDRAISQMMQMDPDLTLEIAKKMAMQSAAVKEQQSLFKELEGDKGNPIVVQEVKKDQRGQKRSWKACKGGDSGDSRKTQ